MTKRETYNQIVIDEARKTGAWYPGAFPGVSLRDALKNNYLTTRSAAGRAFARAFEAACE